VTDDELLERFGAGTLSGRDFHHADHVKVVWLSLRRYPVLEVLARVSAGLRALAGAADKPGLYHETITWAFVFLIHERLARTGHDQGWEEFARANADLLEWKNGILSAYYRDETLHSDLARRAFVLPDREIVRTR
jgi:hypothetical protein